MPIMSIVPIIEEEFLDLTQGFDVEAFWAENGRCQEFTTDKPRCSVSFAPDDYWIFEFMGGVIHVALLSGQSLSRRPASHCRYQ